VLRKKQQARNNNRSLMPARNFRGIAARGKREYVPPFAKREESLHVGFSSAAGIIQRP